MPSNERQALKQEFKRALNNMDWALDKLRKLSETYKEHHPDISETIDMIIIGQLTVQEMTEELEKTI